MKEIQDQLSGLSNRENRGDKIKSINVSCGILERMDIPPGVHDGLIKELNSVIEDTKEEIDAKTAASSTISKCLNAVKNR